MKSKKIPKSEIYHGLIPELKSFELENDFILRESFNINDREYVLEGINVSISFVATEKKLSTLLRELADSLECI